MKLLDVPIRSLETRPELSRTGSARQFEDRLRASIEQIGLAEPLKVSRVGKDKFLVIDGLMRLKAIEAIREANPEIFATVPAYVFDYDRRFEVRYQTDVYQDLLPSQLGALVEHLHQSEHIAKIDIARYIGVSGPTLRNYTGLWRLIQRGGLFARIVELMDVGVLPASNPYAWLRLTPDGLSYVIEHRLARTADVDDWIQETVVAARRGDVTAVPIKTVEVITSGLASHFYREGDELRAVKRDLGLRRAKQLPNERIDTSVRAMRNLTRVAGCSSKPVLKVAADSLKAYLQ